MHQVLLTVFVLWASLFSTIAEAQVRDPLPRLLSSRCTNPNYVCKSVRPNAAYKSFSHYYSTIENAGESVRIHYVAEGEPSSNAVVLIHGWPETWYEWRHIIRPLADIGYYVIAVDTRGCGETTITSSGYDKLTVASDIHLLLTSLGVSRAVVVAHDIGAMIGYAYASLYPNQTRALVASGATPPDSSYQSLPAVPRPGTAFKWWFASLMTEPSPFPETLIGCKEAWYFNYIFDTISNPVYRPNITNQDILQYLRFLTCPGALTAGFNYYRTFWTDVDTLAQYQATKSSVPLLVIEDAVTSGFLTPVYSALFDSVSTTAVPGGHFSPEESPTEFNAAVFSFLAVLSQ